MIIIIIILNNNRNSTPRHRQPSKTLKDKMHWSAWLERLATGSLGEVAFLSTLWSSSIGTWELSL